MRGQAAAKRETDPVSPAPSLEVGETGSRKKRLDRLPASPTAEGGDDHGASRLVDKVGHSAAEGTRGYLALSLDSGGFPVVDVAFNDFGGSQTPVSHAPDGSVAAVSPDAAATEPKT